MSRASVPSSIRSNLVITPIVRVAEIQYQELSFISIWTTYRSDRNTRWKASKIGAPPPTAQTPGPNWLILWPVSPHMNIFKGTEAIFEFHPRSWDMSRKLAIFAYFLTPDLTPQNPINRPISQLPEWNSKIASMPLKVFTWGVSRQKMSQFGPRVWAVGGGCYGFWRLFTLYFNHFCSWLQADGRTPLLQSLPSKNTPTQIKT